MFLIYVQTQFFRAQPKCFGHKKLEWALSPVAMGLWKAEKVLIEAVLIHLIAQFWFLSF